MKKYLGEIGLIFVAIIWGGGFVGTQLAIDGGLKPFQILTLRFLLASTILGIIFYKVIRENIDKESLKSGTFLGSILFIAFATQTIGLQFTTPSKNAFITAANVVIVPFIGFILYRRKLDKIGLISSVITLVGIAILSLEEGLTLNIGDMLTLLSAVAFAFHIFFTSELAPKHNAIVLTTTQFAVAFILSLLFQIVSGQGQMNANKLGYAGVLYLALFSTILGFVTQTICQKIVDSTKTAIILSTEAVFGTILSIIFIGEELTLKLIIGSILIFGSIIASETKLSFIFKNNKDSDCLEDEYLEKVDNL